MRLTLEGFSTKTFPICSCQSRKTQNDLSDTINDSNTVTFTGVIVVRARRGELELQWLLPVCFKSPPSSH